MDKKNCFFVSPIGDEDSSERKNSNVVIDVFLAPACEKTGYKLIRSDQEANIEKLDQSIINHLKNDELVICDLTGYNPNVFYEFGYRQALKLPLIPIITQGSKIPMDVSTLRTITYTTTDVSKTKEIISKLIETINAIQSDESMMTSDYSSDMTSSNIGQTLLTIQDQIADVKDLITERNNQNVDEVAKQVAKYAQPQQSVESALINTLVPLMIQNPESIQHFMEVANNTNNENS